MAMTKIEFFPSKSYSVRRYTLTRDGAEIGQIDCGGGRGTAAIILGGATYTPVIDSVIRGKFHLEANGVRIAGAQSAGFWFRYFNVQAGTRAYTLKMASWFGRRFALMENGTELGRIGVTNAFSGRCQGRASGRYTARSAGLPDLAGDLHLAAGRRGHGRGRDYRRQVAAGPVNPANLRCKPASPRP